MTNQLDHEPLHEPLRGAPAPHEPPPGKGRSMDAFNPLLRGLLSWSLVTRVEHEDGSFAWQLTEGAQRRLEELTPSRSPAASALAYLDHLCAVCREQRLTHLRGGRYICQSCEAPYDAAAPPAPEQGPAHRERLILRRFR